MPRERLDQIIKVASVSIADPDPTDAFSYNLTMGDELVEQWRIPLFDQDEPDIVSLQIDLDGAYPLGTFPKGYDIVIGREKDDPDAVSYTVSEFLAFADAFDLTPEISDGNATFPPIPEGQRARGFNRQTVATLRARLDRPFQNLEHGLRFATAWVGATGGRAGTLYKETAREIWARQTNLRAVPAVGSLDNPQVGEIEYRGEWLVQDTDIKVGDVLLIPNETDEQRFIVQETEREDLRAIQMTVTATLDQPAA